jgi:UDPglucose 6-dehydrogenase
MTEWNEFRALNPRTLKKRMRGDVLVDLCNVFRPEYVEQCGFVYVSIGRPPAEATSAKS